MRLAASHPEWLPAYIGVGQATNSPQSERRRWQWTMKRAKEEGISKGCENSSRSPLFDRRACKRGRRHSHCNANGSGGLAEPLSVVSAVTSRPRRLSSRLKDERGAHHRKKHRDYLLGSCLPALPLEEQQRAVDRRSRSFRRDL